MKTFRTEGPRVFGSGVRAIPSWAGSLAKQSVTVVLVGIGCLSYAGTASAVLPTGCACIDSDRKTVACSDNRLAAVQCSYSTSQVGVVDETGVLLQQPLGLPDLVLSINETLQADGASARIGFDTGVVLEAWGGIGGSGATRQSTAKCNSGGRGSRGYARTMMSFGEVLDLTESSQLSMYIGDKGADSGSKGGKGGAATVLIGQPLSQVTDPMNPIAERVVLIGAGGGGAGGCRALPVFSSESSGGGGRGGCAIARTQAGTFTNCAVAVNDIAVGTGGNGGGGTGSASGGGAAGTGTGGSGAAGNGNDGLGGLGGRNTDDSNWTKWRGSTFEDYFGGAGARGKDNSCVATAYAGTGGGGGAGFGGGGGGGCDPLAGQSCCRDTTRGGGGGGGTSWARTATLDETGVPVVSNASNIVGGEGYGAAAMTFDLGLDVPGSAEADQQKFRGLATHVTRSRVRLHGSFRLAHGLTLNGGTIVSLDRLLAETDGNELATTLRGATLTPVTLSQPTPSDGGHTAVFSTVLEGTEVKMELIRRRGDILDVAISATPVLVQQPAECVADTVAVAPLETRVVIDDGFNPRVVLSTQGDWACSREKGGLLTALP